MTTYINETRVHVTVKCSRCYTEADTFMKLVPLDTSGCTILRGEVQVPLGWSVPFRDLIIPRPVVDSHKEMVCPNCTTEVLL